MNGLSGARPKAPSWFQPTYSPEALQWMNGSLQHQKDHLIDQQERHSMMQRMSITEHFRKVVRELESNSNYEEALEKQCTK